MGWFWSWLWRLAGGNTPYECSLLAQVLAILGEHAFETHRRSAETTRQAFSELSEQARAGKLDAIFPFLREQRRDEHQFVEGHLNDLRELAWHLLSALSKVARSEAEGDAALRQQLQQLAQHAQRPDALNIHALRQTLQALASLIEQREQRHRQTLRQLESQVHYLMRELAQARRENTTDPLTRLYNRRAFEETLQHTVGLNRLFGYPAAMLLVDIDHFKQINDTYGHAVGDAALKWVAEQIVRVCKRKSDFAARYGGEEFAIILRETPLRDAHKIALQLAEQIRRTPMTLPDGGSLHLTVSIGVSELQPHESEQEWFRRTDALLYQAKQAGRDRVAA